MNIATAAGLVGAKCLLCSSDQVYAGSAVRGPHREAEAVRPGNLYGREKLAAEERCMEANPDSVSLRLSWMYDARTLNPGEHSDFLRTLLAKLRTSETLRYPANDMRGITDVNQVAEKLEAAFDLEGGVSNFGAPGTKSMFDMEGPDHEPGEAKRQRHLLYEYGGEAAANPGRELSLGGDSFSGFCCPWPCPGTIYDI